MKATNTSDTTVSQSL